MTKGQRPRDCTADDVARPTVVTGAGERFTGYGVMGLPFSSGHYLALRHFPSSSIGPGYRAVWYRDPEMRWTVYADVPPEVSCARFLGAALAGTRTVPIRITWTDPWTLTVDIHAILHWDIQIRPSPGTRMMSAIGGRLPPRAARAPWLLRAMGAAARPVLGVVRIRLHGTMPNGQTFGAVPRRVWRIETASARLGGQDLGPPGPLRPQDHLADFMLPQRGVFFAHAIAVFSGPAEPSAEHRPASRAVTQ